MTYSELRAWLNGFAAGHTAPWGPGEIKAIRGALDEYEKRAEAPKVKPEPTPTPFDRDAFVKELEKVRPKWPVIQPQRFASGCLVCGVGADGQPMGYVCMRGDCPTNISCGPTL